jgi:hypothetical protein
MEEYLYEFSQRVVKGTRTGEVETGQIIVELDELLATKPENASDEMVLYLEFLKAVARGESYDKYWEKLPKNLKEIFSRVMEKYKGTDIISFVEKLTIKAVKAVNSQDSSQVEKVLSEIDIILKDKPEEGSRSMTEYLLFLAALCKNEESEEQFASLDPQLRDIYQRSVKEAVGDEIFEFLNNMTDMAYTAALYPDIRSRALEELDEILGAEPPEDIRHYLTFLRQVAQGEEPPMPQTLPEELMNILESYLALHKGVTGEKE